MAKAQRKSSSGTTKIAKSKLMGIYPFGEGGNSEENQAATSMTEVTNLSIKTTKSRRERTITESGDPGAVKFLREGRKTEC